MPFDMRDYKEEQGIFISHRFANKWHGKISDSTNSIPISTVDVSPRIVLLGKTRNELACELLIPYYDCENKDELHAHKNEREQLIRGFDASKWVFFQYIDKNIETDDPSYEMMLEEAKIASLNGLEKLLAFELDDSQRFSIPDKLLGLYGESEIAYFNPLFGK